MNIKMTSILLLILIVCHSSAALIVTTSTASTPSVANAISAISSSLFNTFRCYGNFVAVGFRCVPCLADEVAQNGRCVKLLGWGYGSNLIQPNSSYVLGLPNCIKAANTAYGGCGECAKNYDIVMGKCVEQSCKIYSQLLSKCVDDLKPQ